MLNEKMFQLIQLLKRGHSPLTSGMLAQQLKLSARTCKRYIAELIPLLEQHGAASYPIRPVTGWKLSTLLVLKLSYRKKQRFLSSPKTMASCNSES